MFLSNQVAALDTSSIAANTARGAAEVEASVKLAKKKAKLVSSAAELSAQVSVHAHPRALW